MTKRTVKQSARILTRRRLLTAAGAGFAGAAASRLIAPWEAGAAPAQIRGSSLRILTWSHFVPAYDVALDKWANDWGVQNAVNVRVDHIPHDQIPARIASELAAGAGHDIIEFIGNIQTGVYWKNLVDISALCERLDKLGGGWIPIGKQIGQVNGVWYAMPDFYILQPMLWRSDLFKEYDLKPPSTWDLARIAGRVGKSKTPKHDTGIQISHCNDSNHDWRAIFYAFGVKETDPSGKEIAWDSKELREAMRFGKAFYDEAMTPQVLSWDDVSDNRYLDSGVAIFVHDAISAIRSIQDKNPELYAKVNISGTWIEPMGSHMRAPVSDPNAMAVWRFSKNQAAAKAFLEEYGAAWTYSLGKSKGYNMPFLRKAYTKPMPGLGDDPSGKTEFLQDWGKYTLFFGYPGPTTPAASEVLVSYVIPDMMARYVRSNDLEGSIKWGMGQIKSIYAKYKA